MSRSYKKDYALGKKGEKEVLPTIRQYFGRDIVKSVNRYEKFDFKDDIHKYELKCRDACSTTYDTTIIASDKICPNMIFLFKFYDGLYYIKYDKTVFDNYEKRLFVRFERDDYIDIEKFYIFIPVSDLQKIN